MDRMLFEFLSKIVGFNRLLESVALIYEDFMFASYHEEGKVIINALKPIKKVFCSIRDTELN